MGRGLRYALVIVFASMLLLTGFNIWYSTYVSNRAARQSARNICPLMETLDNVYRELPPTTDTGRVVAAEIHDLVKADC